MADSNCLHLSPIRGSSGALVCTACGAVVSADHAQGVEARRSQLAAVLAVTTPEPFGYRVDRVLHMVDAERVYGANVFRDMAATFVDNLGGRSLTLERGFREAREEVLDELKLSVVQLGGNALLGTTISSVGVPETRMILVAGSGTAAVISRHEGDPANSDTTS